MCPICIINKAEYLDLRESLYPKQISPTRNKELSKAEQEDWQQMYPICYFKDFEKKNDNIEL
jgi:hypothetical protein